MKSLRVMLIEKYAKIKDDVKLYEHQEKALGATGNNALYAHATGAGKTLTGIAKFEKMRENGQATKALVIVPSGLRHNFSEEGVGKFTDSRSNVVGTKQERRKGIAAGIDPDADYNIISYDLFRRDPEKYLRESGADTVITDESHRSRNEGTLTLESMKSDAFNAQVKNYIGLTGSVTSNSPADIVPLVQVASRGQIDIGKDKDDFMKRYVKRSDARVYRGLNEKRIPIVGFNHRRELIDKLKPYVHYMDHEDVKEIADFPDKDLEVVKVPLSREQAKLYKRMVKDDPEIYKLIKQKRYETLKNDEASMTFNKLIEMRKLMNDPSSVIGASAKTKTSPKVERMLDDLEKHLKENEDGQALLFSHLINGGINTLEPELKERGIEYGRFIGKGNEGVTEETRQSDVQDYKDRKKRVMLISSAGGEGLSLGDTTFEGVLDPHFNPEKMQQMEARGVRAGGLKGRADRTVDVNRYIATMPKTLGIFPSSYDTPDEIIYDIAQGKEQQNKIMHDLLKDVRREQERSQMKKVAGIRGLLIEKLASQAVPEIDAAMKTKLEKDVATMMATSHEYKKPNVDAALAFTKNYTWEKSKEKVSNLQGLDKPTDKKKVEAIKADIEENGLKSPVIVVDKIHGIRPQTRGKKILLDGHHRIKGAEAAGVEEVPVYRGTFTGEAQKPKEELREKAASDTAFGPRTQQQISRIQAQAANKRMVEMKYKDAEGNITTRLLEPYKLSGDDFWAYDPEKNSIRRFKVKNMKSVKPSSQTYEPRWPIETQSPMSKIASTAWKRNMAGLSDQAINLLENKKILDRRKMMDGLERGNEELIKKHDILYTNDASKAMKELSGRLGGRHNLNLIGMDPKASFRSYQSLFDNNLGGAATLPNPAYSKRPGGIIYQSDNTAKAMGGTFGHHAENIQDNPYIDDDMKDAGKRFLELLNGDMNDPQNIKDFNTLVKRHEIDEVRSTNKNLRKNKFLKNPQLEGVKASPYAISSHNSPEVIINESRNAAFAPKSVKEMMMNMRILSSELGTDATRKGQGFYATNVLGDELSYGRAGVRDNKHVRKMEKFMENEYAKAGYEPATRDYLPEFSAAPEKKTFLNRMKDKFLTKVGADENGVTDLNKEKQKRTKAFMEAVKKSLGSSITIPVLIDEDTLNSEEPRGVAQIPGHLKK